MKKSITYQLAMFKTVRDTVDANGTIWGGIPAFVDSVNTLREKIAELEALDQEQSGVNLGVRAAKDEVKLLYLPVWLRFKGALNALAKSTSNLTLREQMHITENELLRAPNQTVMNRVERIVNAAQENVEALGVYGITPTEVNALTEMRNELEKALMSTRKVQIERKVITGHMDALSKEINDLLKNDLDQLMLTIKGANPLFYGTYKSARKVIKFGHRSTNENE